MEDMKSRLLLAYILMLMAHQAQIFEELWDHSYLVTAFGDGVYILANWLLFCIPMVALFFVFMEKKWAYYLSIVYAVFMMFQGVERIVLSFVQGDIFTTLPVVVTGAIIYVIGIPMVYYLYMNIERLNNKRPGTKRLRAMYRME